MYQEKRILKRDIYALAIPDLLSYKNNLKLAGFTVDVRLIVIGSILPLTLQVEDVTDSHIEYTKERVEKWEKDEKQLWSIHRRGSHRSTSLLFSALTPP